MGQKLKLLKFQRGTNKDGNRSEYYEHQDNTVTVKPQIYNRIEMIKETPENRSLKYTARQLETTVPFNDYTKASDMGKLRAGLANLIGFGVSNCTLNATNSYGDKYTRASAKTIVKGDPDYIQVTGQDVIPGTLLIQSLPNTNDDDNNIFHSAIFSGTADSSYVNKFGDIINKGDSLYRYSNGGSKIGDFRERPKQALMNNHGKTRFRYYRINQK